MQTFLHTVARVVGSEAIDDVVSFFRAFEGMEAGFRDRAIAVEALLAAPETGFVLVTSPRRDATEEAEYFARQLDEKGKQIDALIVNRVHPSFGDEAPAGLRAAAEELARPRGRRGRPAPGALREPRRLPGDRPTRTGARGGVAGSGGRAAPSRSFPTSSRDVYDFAALREIGRLLIAPGACV